MGENLNLAVAPVALDAAGFADGNEVRRRVFRGLWQSLVAPLLGLGLPETSAKKATATWESI